ncbi:MAG: cation:proton antiporter [Patescibacteria group bacterium]
MPKFFFPTLRLLLVLALVAFVSTYSTLIIGLFQHSGEPELLMTFFSIALIFSLSFGIFYLARGTPLPSFVIAVFFGMAAQPLLEPVTQNQAVLGALVGFGATLILFGGGLETPFENFKKLFGKIMMLSFVGLGFTAIAFAFGVHALGAWTGFAISFTTAILLGALLSSTDPAAIIPVLKRLRFNNPSTKDIIVSESAVTDVTGTLLTVAFLALAASGLLESGILNGYQQIFTLDSAKLLFKQLVFGTAFGIVGYALLHVLTRFKGTHEREYEADSAFFLFIPIIIFTLALAFGGSGYLAAFVAGLMFKLNECLHETERFFNHTIDGFFKPTIFLMLGALIDLKGLFEYAPVGLLIALVFMFIIRPLAVFLSLAPFTVIGKDRTTWREIAFISFVRETGAIPAVLLVTIASLKIANIEGLLPIGLWVILSTLTIEPLLTPWVAEKLKVATIIPDVDTDISAHADSVVVLGSRGNSWKRRLPLVADWASRHQVPNVTLLMCYEYQHTPEKAAKAQLEFAELMKHINLKLVRNGYKPLRGELMVSEGLLQENIDRMSKVQNNILAFFVGRKMLDYKLDEIKRLSIPLFFMS